MKKIFLLLLFFPLTHITATTINNFPISPYANNNSYKFSQYERMINTSNNCFGYQGKYCDEIWPQISNHYLAQSKKVQEICPEFIIAQKLETALNRHLSYTQMQNLNQDTVRQSIIYVLQQYKNKKEFHKIPQNVIEYLLSVYDIHQEPKFIEGCFGDTKKTEKIGMIRGGWIQIQGYVTKSDYLYNPYNYGDSIEMPMENYVLYISKINSAPSEFNHTIQKPQKYGTIMCKSNDKIYTQTVHHLIDKKADYYSQSNVNKEDGNILMQSNKDKTHTINLYIPLQVLSEGGGATTLCGGLFRDIKIVE